MIKVVGTLLCLFFGVTVLNAQHLFTPTAHKERGFGYFVGSHHQRYGFYSNSFLNKDKKIKIYHKSVGRLEADTVKFVVSHHRQAVIPQLSFWSDSLPIKHFKQKQDTLFLALAKRETNYSIEVLYREDTLAILKVDVLPKKKQIVSIVPLMDVKINADSIRQRLDSIFHAANLTFDIRVLKKFKMDTTYDSWNNPEGMRLRYTSQMIHLRNAYLQKYPQTNKNQLLFFITPEFNDSTIASFMVKNKAMGFVSENHLHHLSYLIAKEFVRSYLNSEYVVLEGEQRFTNDLWNEINHHPDVYSLIDDYEDVVTDNGIIAYYLFEEDSTGNILLKQGDWLSSILRPTKKNTYSYHLQIDNPLFKPIIFIWNKSFNLMHFLMVIGTILGLSVLFRRVRLYMQHRLKMKRIWRFSTRFVEWTLILLSGWGGILLVDFANRLFEQTEGPISEYAGKSMRQVSEDLIANHHPRDLQEAELGSEILIKRGKEYNLSREKCVLEFNVMLDKNDQIESIQFLKSSDSLHLSQMETPQLAKSHYLVFHYYCENHDFLKDEIYNHLGVNLTDKLNLEDPPRRILLFVNGYRPTSLGRTFEESFEDIKKNGLEFPNSLNRIYDSDRYNYWHPWNKIDDKFIQRINPTETFYADGHYSVTTSNYRSLLKFTSTSTRYPQRCKDSTHHVCYETDFINLGYFGKIRRNTYGMLATRSNKSGFQTRVRGGEIAGRNLFQLLNEIPNNSQNDTLYIVAHSMGFAYAQGILEKIRGKIQLGGFYILAPEDGKAGRVNPKEWKEIWQYGSNLDQKKRDAPCLQDGVAPQSGIKGLENNRIFISGKNYYHKGFFDSHFIGYYEWILKIKEGKKGVVHQH